MSIGIGPSLSTSGLIFEYDMSNISKSWKGAPTVNYVPNADTMASWGSYGNGNDGTFITEFGTTGYQMINRGSWNGIARSITIPATGTYTFSAWVRYIGGSVNNNGGGPYISGWGGGDTATVTSRTFPGQWQRLSVTLACTNLTFTFYLISWGGTSGADNSTWQVTMPQAEAGSVATPFVLGTRSTTNNIVDLTGNNTVTANSLTYASDGSFSFNGSSNYISVADSNNWDFGTGDFAVDFWIKLLATQTDYAGYVGTFIDHWTASGWIIMNSTSADGINIRFYTNDVSTGEAGNLFATVTLNTWNHIVITRIGDTGYLYKNGILIASTSWTGKSINDSGNPLQIGRAGGVYSNSSIPSVKIYKNKGLSAQEVLQNFNALRSRFGI